MRPDEYDRVAELICHSTNRWYQACNKPVIFPHGPSSCRLFCEVYEDLDPGCCVIAEDSESGELLGSCFYHPRETHVSLGIMNARPEAFGRGVAKQLLAHLVNRAEREGKPVRLVSSAMNLDSFSLYSRFNFEPTAIYQDMYLKAPLEHLKEFQQVAERFGDCDFERVRDATMDDVPAMVALEERLNHIRREKDFRYFIENRRGIWHTSVYESEQGEIEGFLVSVSHPGSNMLGPGVMRTQEQALTLVLRELEYRAGSTPVFLVPTTCRGMLQNLYRFGARNCEIHFAQVRRWQKLPPSSGVIMPTFMPETQ